MMINRPDKSRPLKSIPLDSIVEELRLRGYQMKDNDVKEKQTITKVVTVRLFGIKILTFTIQMPSFGMNLLSACSGTDEALL